MAVAEQVHPNIPVISLSSRLPRSRGFAGIAGFVDRVVVLLLPIVDDRFHRGRASSGFRVGEFLFRQYKKHPPFLHERVYLLWV